MSELIPDVAAAMVYATDHGADIINLSFGGSHSSILLENAVNYAAGNDVIMIAAAGNNGASTALYPARYDTVTAVGAIDQNLEHATFSNYGSDVDLVAPGRDVLVINPSGEYTVASGTSLAAAHATGMVALGVPITLGGEIAASPMPEPNPEATITPTPEAESDTVLAQIVGGSEVNPEGTYPWQVRVNGVGCGGSLVDTNLVVTAAHCVFDNNNMLIATTSINVIAGVHDLTDTAGSQFLNVTQIIVHPNYVDGNSFDNDVAVLVLNGNVTLGGTGDNRVGLIPLVPSTVGALVGTTATVTGWGRLSEGGTSPNELQEVDLPIISNAVCNDDDHYDGRVTPRMMCAGVDAGGIDACQGDSGGPLVINRGGGFELAGIVSWGDGCARENRQGIYTRVSEFVGWDSQSR